VDFGCGQPKPSSGRQPFGFWGVGTRACAEYRFDPGYDISGFQPFWNSTGKVFPGEALFFDAESSQSCFGCAKASVGGATDLRLSSFDDADFGCGGDDSC
jgi:hypothetical protein